MKGVLPFWLALVSIVGGAEPVREIPAAHWVGIYLGKTSMTDHRGEGVIRHAEVVFHSRDLEQTLVLQPQEFPSRRVTGPE